MKLDAINCKVITAQSDFLTRIIQIDVNSDHCFLEMDNLLRSDQGTVSLVLRVANSAMYCRGKPIETIPRAINLLGVGVIRSLAVLSVSRSIFSQCKNQLVNKHIWQHSLLTALASQQICIAEEENKLGEEIFVAGLLHDIGKVLLFCNVPDAYIQALDYTLETACTGAEAERKFLEIDHFEVGRKAIKEWNLPAHFDRYTSTDLESLSPELKKNKVLYFLAIANNLIKHAGYGANPSELDVRKEKLKVFGISDGLIDYLLEESFMQQLFQNEIYVQSA